MPVMPPQDQATLQKMVLAGKKVMYDKKVFPLFAQGMKGPQPLPQKLAMEASGLVKLLQDRAHGTLPIRLLIPMAMMLLLDMADFMQKASIAKITIQDLQAAIKMLIDVMNKVFGGKQQNPLAAAPAGAPTPQQPQQQPTPPAAPMGGMIQQGA